MGLTPVDPHLAAWDVLDWMIARGWTARAIASATGLPPRSITAALELARTGYRRRFGAGTADAIINHRQPTDGHVSAIGSTRKIRGLAGAGWTTQWIADHYGIPKTTLSHLARGHYTRTDTHLAAAIDRAWQDLRHATGPSWVAIHRARTAGWAPAYAWAGIDIDDPGVCLIAYPKTDRPSPTRSEVTAARREHEARKARKAAHADSSHAEPTT